MAAVAWVPNDPHEETVISGFVPGLTAASYRAFPSTVGRESTSDLRRRRDRKPTGCKGGGATIRVGSRRFGRMARGCQPSTRRHRSPRQISSGCSMSRR